MREYIEILCMSAEDVFGEISRRVKEDFEFVSVIVTRPGTFLLRMKCEPSKRSAHHRAYCL
jgi:hypothetical protein